MKDGGCYPGELILAGAKMEPPLDTNNHTDLSASPESKEAHQIYMGRGAEATTPFISEPEQRQALLVGH